MQPTNNENESRIATQKIKHSFWTWRFKKWRHFLFQAFWEFFSEVARQVLFFIAVAILFFTWWFLTGQ